MENKNEQVLQQKYLELQRIGTQLKQLEKQAMMFDERMLEVIGTINAISEIIKVEEGKEILIPLSSGIFIPATVKKTNQLSINVGENVVVEKTPVEARELLTKQKEELENAKNNVMNSMISVQQKAQAIEQEMLTLIQAGKNV